MENSSLKNTVLVQAAFVVAMIAAAALVSWLAARVAVLFTGDVPTVVAVTVASVWVAEMALYVFRACFLYGRKIRSMRSAGAPQQDIDVQSHRMKSRYTLAGVVFAALLGYVCFGVYRNVIDAQQSAAGVNGGIDWALAAKVAVTVVLLAVIVYRIKRNG